MSARNRIHYAAVYDYGKLIGEYPPKEFPRYAEIVQKVAAKEAKEPKLKRAKLSMDATQTVVNYRTIGDGKMYACISSAGMETRKTFGLLQDLEEKIGRGGAGSPRGASFGKFIHERMEWRNNPFNDQMSVAQGLVEETRGVMMENVQALQERGEKLEDMVERTAAMAGDAEVFEGRARQIRKNACWADWKSWICMWIIIITVPVMIAMGVCGPDFSKCG